MLRAYNFDVVLLKVIRMLQKCKHLRLTYKECCVHISLYYQRRPEVIRKSYCTNLAEISFHIFQHIFSLMIFIGKANTSGHILMIEAFVAYDTKTADKHNMLIATRKRASTKRNLNFVDWRTIVNYDMIGKAYDNQIIIGIDHEEFNDVCGTSCRTNRRPSTHRYMTWSSRMLSGRRR